jgi:hypothetical protein
MNMPDRATLMSWMMTAAGRGIAWYLAVHLGLQAAQAGSIADALVQGVCATGLALATLWHSVHERTDLLAAGSNKKAGGKP